MADVDWRAWTPRLAKYYEALLRAQGGRGTSHLHDVRAAMRYGLTADLASFAAGEEEILERARIRLKLEADQSHVPDDDELGLSILEHEEGEEEEGPEPDDGAQAPGPDPQAAATLRRIARKQRNDPHNRETLLGFPLIAARIGKKRICGPLLVWEMGIEYDPRDREILLQRRNTTPDLNTILLGKLADDPDDISLANEKLMPLLLQEDFGPNKIPDLMRVLTGIFAPLARYEGVDSRDYSLKEFLQLLGAIREDDPALITMRPLLTNGSRSHAFLLSDLRQIAAQGNPGGESVLRQIVGDVPREGAPDFDAINLPFDDTADGGSPLWFPFPSNRAQREVAQTATRVGVLTVQGPPGTGKSQTIANLVCHLVTEGHSVLVTSHQRKAMEVLTKMLSGFDGLALSMLSGDQESLQRLRTQLEGLQDRPPDHLTPDSIERAQAALLENDRSLRRLARRFLELRRIEHEEFPAFSRYEDLRDFDHISPDDEPIEERVDEYARLLAEWCRLHASLLPGLRSFEAVFRPNGVDTSRVREQNIAETLKTLLESAETLDTPVSQEGREVAARLTAAVPGEELAAAARLRDWIDEEGPELQRNLRDLGHNPDDEATLGRWMDALGAIARDRIEAWKSQLEGVTQFSERSELKGTEHSWDVIESNAHGIRKDARFLSTRGRSLLGWILNPESYRCRRRLRELGFSLRYASRNEDLEEIDGSLRWIESYAKAEALLQEVVERLPLSSFGSLRPRRRTSLLNAAQRARSATSILEQLESVPAEELDQAFGLPVALRRLGTEQGRAFLTEALSEAERWIVRQDLTSDLASGLDLAEPWGGRVRAVIAGIQEGQLSRDAREALDRLQRVHRHYPHFRRMLDLESVELSGLSSTVRNLRSEIGESREAPAWLDHADKALEAHRLSSLLRGSLVAHPDNLEEISEALREGQKKRRNTIAGIIKRKRELATYRALQSPPIRVPLLGLRKLLRRKRLNDSLLALRDSINYEAVLDVFPCWISTIDDAARLFPPKAGLFDYLIVDEASQCSQATSMPLAFRAKRMIVVGDKKQLQPATSMFLAENTIRLLQGEHGIDEHPKAHFLDGKESLLGLAEACSNASRFLDEHFRCDPAIIKWSNGRFYDNRLQILTRRRPDRARFPLEVRELQDADEDRDKKVNAEEAAAVVREVRRLISSGEADGKTIGAISPFRPQAELLQLLFAREFHEDPELLKEHQIVASTADGFQGDERDIVLYSFRQGPSSHAGSITTIQRSEERLNVAFTRARQRGICFVSIPVHEFPDGAVRSFLEHAKSEHHRADSWDVEGELPDQFDSSFEESVCNRLRDRGLRVTTQVPCGRYRIDLVVEDEDGRRLAVECDGEWKMDELGQLRPEDYQRQDIIERAGWAVQRISGRRWLLNPEREVELVLEALNRQPTRAAMDTLRGPVVQPDLKAFEEAEPTPVREVATTLADAFTGDLFDAVDELSVEGEEAVGTGHEFGERPRPRPSHAEVTIHRLIRWIILRPQVEWTVVDRLEEILQLARGGVSLMPAQTEFLEEAMRWATKLGFDPGIDPEAESD